MAVIAEVALRRNPEARFEEVYASCQPRVFRTCLAILRNTDDAAEATQEVFSRALPLLTQLREPQVWLQTVARNYCLDQLRRQKVRGLGTPLDEETPGSLRDDPERETLLRDALRQAFEALTPRERRALARVLLMDDSLADIAAMLGVSYSAAAQVVSRARRRAALAARAVIGASLAWLGSLSFPRSRERVTRAAAQLVDSGQHVLLAAAVLFTAGTIAHPVEAVGSGGGDVPALAPRVTVVPAAGGADADMTGAASSLSRAGGGTGSTRLPGVLPPGKVQFAGATLFPDRAGSQSNKPGGSPPQPNAVNFYVTPTTQGKCVGVSASAGTGPTPNLVNQSPTACY